MTARFSASLCFALLLLLAACSGNTSGKLGGVHMEQGLGLPQVSELDNLRGPSETQQIDLDVLDYLEGSGPLSDNGNGLKFSTTPAESTAWALYSYELGDTTPFSLFVNFAGVKAGLWLGVANYSTGRWEWSTRKESSPYIKPIGEQSGNNYISPGGRVYFCVLGQGSQTLLLTQLRMIADVPPVPTYTISGTLLDDSLQPIAGCPVNITPPDVEANSNANGEFTFSGVVAGDYVITPVNPAYTFEPLFAEITLVDADISDVDFSGTPLPTYAISGTVLDDGAAPLPGAQLTLNPGNIKTNSDINGEFSFPGNLAGSYTLSAALSGYTFAPPGINLDVIDQDLGGQDFTGTPVPTYSISGNIIDNLAAPLPGVTVTLGPLNIQVQTDGSGNYEFSGVNPGNYLLTPNLAAYTFNPVSLVANVVNADVTGRNFTGTQQGTPVSYLVDILPIIEGDFGSEYACVECHSGSFPDAGLDMTSYSQVKAKAATVNNRINRMQGSIGFMPKGKTKWTPENLQLFQDWIDQGYLP